MVKSRTRQRMSAKLRLARSNDTGGTFVAISESIFELPKKSKWDAI